MREVQPIPTSIMLLKEDLHQIARVAEWADKMGYNCPKRFARPFTSFFGERLQTSLYSIRLRII